MNGIARGRIASVGIKAQAQSEISGGAHHYNRDGFDARFLANAYKFTRYL